MKNNWRVREAALEELVSLSFHEREDVRNQARDLLLSREGEEKDRRVSAHFPQREKTLERKKNWDTHLKRTIDPSVDRLARERLIGAPIIRSAPYEGPFSVVQREMDGGNYELAWHNLLIMVGRFFETATKADTLPLYDILEKLIPHLQLEVKEKLLDKILFPLSERGFYPQKLIELNLTIAKWLTKSGVELYAPALKIYGEALHLAIKLEQDDLLQTLYKNSSKLLSALIFQQLDLLHSPSIRSSRPTQVRSSFKRACFGKSDALPG